MEQWDVWTTKEVVFPNLEAGRVALQDNELLDPFFGAWIDTLDRIDAAPSISSSTALARKMPAFGVNVLMIGEAGGEWAAPPVSSSERHACRLASAAPKFAGIPSAALCWGPLIKGSWVFSRLTLRCSFLQLVSLPLSKVSPLICTPILPTFSPLPSLMISTHNLAV